MKLFQILMKIALLSVFSTPNQATEPKGPGIAAALPTESKASLVDKMARQHIFTDPQFFHWGGTPILGDDGLYHLYYDRWPRDNPRGMFGWLYITEIAHATSKFPEGPYVFQDVAIKSAGDQPKGRWDAVNAHNAYITRFPNPKTGKLRYYLYFISNRGEKTMSDPWLVHVANQRIGVAWSDSPTGPWTRHSEPICQPEGPLQHYTVNPAVTRLPDGRYLMLLKGRAPVPGKPKEWGPMSHGWALAATPTGPFKIQNTLLFPKEIPAEDPCVWVQEGRVFAAVKDWNGKLSKQAPGISWVYGDLLKNGSIDWKIPKNPLISERILRWKDGSTTPVYALERPYVLLNTEGQATHLFAACAQNNEFTGSSATPKNPPAPIPDTSLPFNVCLPLHPAQ